MSDKPKPLTDRLGNPLEFGDPEFNPNPERNYSEEYQQQMNELRARMGLPPKPIYKQPKPENPDQ